MIESATLRNGSTQPMSSITTTMLALRQLSPIELYELREFCFDESHQVWGSAVKSLTSLGLVDDNGNVHETVRAVVESAIVGDGPDIRLIGPIKKGGS